MRMILWGKGSSFVERVGVVVVVVVVVEVIQRETGIPVAATGDLN